jgi:glycine hydroxymethyltransferase
VGTPAATSRGFTTEDMPVVAKLFKLAATEFETKADYIRSEVDKLCEKYPLYE